MKKFDLLLVGGRCKMNGNVQNTAGSSQRDPPSLVLEVEGLQPFIQKSLNPLHFKHKSGGVHAGPTQL